MKELLVALALAHGADSVTTAINLAAGNGEGNPLLPRHVVANVVVQSAETAVQLTLLQVLARHKPRLARSLAIACLVSESVVVGYNVRVRLDARR